METTKQELTNVELRHLAERGSRLAAKLLRCLESGSYYLD